MTGTTEAASPCIRADRAWNVAYYGSIVVVPWLWATLLPLVLATVCFTRADHSLFAAARRAAGYKYEVLSGSGPVAVMYAIIGNLCAFGIVIVACWALPYVWTAKRVCCVLICALLTATILEWRVRYPALHFAMTQDATLRAFAEEDTGPLKFGPQPRVNLPKHTPVLAARTWDTLVWTYAPLALLGIPGGALIAMLPIFKPGARYYLRRGLCPKCEYDLCHKTDAGCPECGWNRPADCA